MTSPDDQRSQQERGQTGLVFRANPHAKPRCTDADVLEHKGPGRVWIAGLRLR